MKNKTGPKRTDPTGELRQRPPATILKSHKERLKGKDAKPYFDLGLSFAITAFEQGKEAAMEFVKNHFQNLKK